MSTPMFSALIPAVLLGATLTAQVAPRAEFEVRGAQVRLWTEGGVEKSAVSRDGGRTWVPLPDSQPQLNIRYRSFDPADGDPAVPPTLLANGSSRLFFVQFKSDIIPEYRDALLELGAEVSFHMPNQAYLARMNRDLAATVEQQAYVRAVADMHIAYKLEEEIIADLAAGVDFTQRFNVMLVNKRTDAAAVEKLVEDLGGAINMRAEGGILIEATLTRQQLEQVARSNEVLWIDRWGPPELDIDNARIQADVNYVETVAGIDGQGMRGHVLEGVYSTHVEFAARPPYRTTPQAVLVNGTGGSGTGHGTNTAGEVYAMGARPDAKGILPYAQMFYTNYNGTVFNTNNRYPLTQRLVDPNDQYKVMIQTASWGYPRTTQYTSRSAEMDDITYDFDIYVTQSQSNAGATSIPQNSRPQAWAKNVNGIGGFQHGNNTNPGDDCWCRTGSTGPAADGRVGVSFAAYYDAILTTNGTSNGYTTGFGGTSGATPIINGLGGCVIEMFTDGLFGYPGVSWQDRFDARPMASTTRALLAVSTRQLAMTQSRRVQQGWGFPNMRDLYDNRNKMLVVDEEDVLTQGQKRSYFVFVRPGTLEFRASMAHREQPAAPQANPTRHNSLDLVVLDSNGTQYNGNTAGPLIGNNAKHFSNGSSNPFEFDDKNTHENVFLQFPQPGLYQIDVTAKAIRMDGHPATPAMDTSFGLAVRGIGGGRDRSGMLLDLISNSANQFDVSLTNVPAGGWVGGLTLLSINTSRHVALGNLFGLEADVLTLVILGSPVGTGNVFHFDSNGSPSQYPNATFSFPPAVAAVLTGQTFDGVAFLYDSNAKVVEASNVDRVTVQ